MKNYIKTALVAAIVFGSMVISGDCVMADDTSDVDFNRDYISEVYNSDNGLDGSSANCIYSSDDGFIWIGCYTGLYRYDGTEFKRFTIDGNALPVNDIIQSSDGTLWIGTNGDGLYQYDGQNFTQYDLLMDKNGVDTIETLYIDSENTLWIGTKAGLFSNDENAEKPQFYEELSDKDIRDMGELSTGEKVVIEKKGGLYNITDSKFVHEIKLSGYDGDSVPRCVSDGKDDYFYIGTDGEEILKVDNDGNVCSVITCSGGSSFNDISEFEDGKYWACSDNGVCILEDDVLSDSKIEMSDSVEECCTDYQGNYWFASSRVGIMELYANDYANLGAYWNLYEVINSIEAEEDIVYVGSDNGLYCYKEGYQEKNNLTKECTGERIRQIYKDDDGRLWVSTYGSGIFVQDTDGNIYKINKSNSNLTTDRIRCVFQKQDGNILIGTEEGLFICEKNTQISRLTDDEVLNSNRVLDICESKNGKIYVATDGYGVYVIETDGTIKNYTKKEGLTSVSVMKAVPSENLDGTWLVMGEGICFLSDDGKISKVAGISSANTLDMLLTDDGSAIIIASNGIFKADESELLNEDGQISYTQSDKQDGLPIDFTANAWNVLEGDTLYLCGTSGAASIDISKERITRNINVYVESVTADEETVEVTDNSIVIPASTHRLSINIRPINYVYRNILAGYSLEGVDSKETIFDGNSNIDISYTDLDGGDYTYHYRILDTETQDTLAQLDLHVTKSYKFWEVPYIKKMLYTFIVIFIILLLIVAFCMIEWRVRKHYSRQMRKEKEEEIARLAYHDLATGAYSRNYYEEEVEKVNPQSVFAAFAVSVNYVEYYKRERGILFAEEMLRTGIAVLEKEIDEDDVKIFRISDNVFFFWITRSVQLEEFISNIKTAFKDKGAKDKTFSFSVGGSYNDRRESIRSLLDRCERMRMLDEKLSEARFIDGKINTFE